MDEPARFPIYYIPADDGDSSLVSGGAFLLAATKSLKKDVYALLGRACSVWATTAAVVRLHQGQVLHGFGWLLVG